MTIKSAKENGPVSTTETGEKEPPASGSDVPAKEKGAPPAEETFLAAEKEVLKNTVPPGPTYGDLKKQVARLEEALEKAARAAARDRERAARAEAQAESVRARTSKEKKKLLQRAEGAEGRAEKNRRAADRWLALKASPVGKYLTDDGKPSSEVPSSLSRDGDWINPLMVAYKRAQRASSEKSLLEAVERHADLDRKRPAQCACPACKLRKHIEEQKAILVELKKDNDRLLRELDKERGKKVKHKRRGR